MEQINKISETEIEVTEVEETKIIVSKAELEQELSKLESRISEVKNKLKLFDK